MNITSKVRYAIMKFINEFLDSYVIFSDKKAEDFINSQEGYEFSYCGETGRFAKGCSKICLFFDSLPTKVIKIPLIHSMSRQSEGQFTERVRTGKIGKINVYKGNDNLCEVEAENYLAAEDSGIAEFFAAEEKIMTYMGVPVYIQDKVKEVYRWSRRKVETPDREFQKEIQCCLNEHENEFSDAVYDLLEFDTFKEDLYHYAVTAKRFIQILTFLSDFEINDLHDENIGYGYNGMPIFFDYSGFGFRGNS